MKKIGLLATGDEIVNGDILNTNAQKIAQSLFELGIPIGMHVIASDKQAEIEAAIAFLLHHHDALIITGGLGPTSDDRTRFALANTINSELVFDEDSWQNILERFKRINLVNQPESNRQQAMFPKGATILANPFGTARGCYIKYLQGEEYKSIFMLPGPPSECLPMFRDFVIPILQQTSLAEPYFFKRWLLFQVSEGEIAEKLDVIAHPLAIETGYRISMPYVEFKVKASSLENLAQFELLAESILKVKQINPENIPASELLAKKLELLDRPIYILDQATKGLLHKAIVTSNNYHQIMFIHNKNQMKENDILIEGLQDAWEKNAGASCQLTIYFNGSKEILTVPYRQERTFLFAIELISQKLLTLLFS